MTPLPDARPPMLQLFKPQIILQRANQTTDAVPLTQPRTRCMIVCGGRETEMMILMFGLAKLLTGVVALLCRALRIAAARLLTGMTLLPWRATRTTGPPPPQRSWPRPWPPEAGDDIEKLSRYVDCWFPAVVTARSSSGGGWPSITVRIRGNAEGAVTTDVLESEIRPIQRLAAAQRKPADGALDAYDAYDRDNIRHLLECGGCPECDGLGAYYRECACERLHHRLADPCRVCGK